MLDEWFSMMDIYQEYQLELIYSSDDFGCSSYVFHKRCDGQGPTVTFVQSEDYDMVFGGFTSISWNSSETGTY